MPPGDRRVLEVFAPPDGGVAEHALRLTDGIRDHGWVPEVVAPAGSEFVPRLRALGVVVHELPFRRAPGPWDARAIAALRRIDAGGRFDVVHAHSSKAGALVRAGLPRARRRAVYTPHCFSFAAGFGRAGRFAYRLAERALVPRTARIIAACEWERGVAREIAAPDDRVRVVYLGVPEPPAGAPDPRIAAFAAGRPVAGMVSVLRPQKDPLALVRAAALLRDRGADACVALVGNGELAGAVTAEIDRLGLGDVMRLFPFAGESHSALRAFDVFVLPSLWEALPISLMEAMSCSLPVVATRVNGVPEAVLDGVTGTLVAPGSPEALAGAVAGLLGDPAARARAAAAGRAHYEARFTVGPMLAAIAGIYDEIAQAAG